MSGSFDLGSLQITYSRLWIFAFALFVFAALIVVLRRTRFGLQMRAVTQNRAMASAMGIRTPWIDALTFGLGSGIAGIAGVALSQIDNVSPNLGQGYIIDSFMVVVFGGVGNLWGTLVGAFTLGIVNKFLEPYRRRGARQDPRARLHHPLHPEAPARPLRAEGKGGGGVMMAPGPSPSAVYELGRTPPTMLRMVPPPRSGEGSSRRRSRDYGNVGALATWSPVEAPAKSAQSRRVSRYRSRNGEAGSPKDGGRGSLPLKIAVPIGAGPGNDLPAAERHP